MKYTIVSLSYRIFFFGFKVVPGSFLTVEALGWVVITTVVSSTVAWGRGTSAVDVGRSDSDDASVTKNKYHKIISDNFGYTTNC